MNDNQYLYFIIETMAASNILDTRVRTLNRNSSYRQNNTYETNLMRATIFGCVAKLLGLLIEYFYVHSLYNLGILNKKLEHNTNSNWQLLTSPMICNMPIYHLPPYLNNRLHHPMTSFDQNDDCHCHYLMTPDLKW